MSLLPLPSPSSSLTKLAVASIAPRNLRLKTSIMMGSERLLYTYSRKKRVVEKEDEAEAAKEVKAEACGDLEAMTFHQLRTMSKNFGISSKGSKVDLMSSLKCFLDNGIGQSPPVTSEMKPNDPEISPISNAKNSNGDAKNSNVHKGTPSKRKAKNVVQAQNLNLDADVSSFQQKKRKEKPQREDGAGVKVNSKSIKLKQTVPIKTNKVSGTKASPTKRKGLPQSEDKDGGSTDTVGLSEKCSEPWTIFSHKKPQEGWIPYNPKTMRLPPPDDNTKFTKLISWNVNGLRALLKLDSFSTFAQRENFDILCLQETKLQEKDVEKIKERFINGYDNSFWTCSVSKLGYSGTAIISRIKPLSVRYGLGIVDHDSEGRLVTMEFDNFYLISGYVPNSGDGLRRLTYRVTQWDPSLGNYMKELEKSKPVILTGDLNCAHQEIDIYNPAGNKRSAGFTYEERESFEKNFLSKGFVDTFRSQHPGVVGYTYWGYRHNGRVTNKGWRLDYFLVSESIADKVHDSYIIPDVTGSDHCPIGLILKL